MIPHSIFPAIGWTVAAVVGTAAVVAQTIAAPTTGWGTAAIFGMLALQAWKMYLDKENGKITNAKIDQNTAITEHVGKTVNSQFDIFKKDMGDRLAVSEAKIVALEAALNLEREMAKALAAGKAMAPEQREKIIGETR